MNKGNIGVTSDNIFPVIKKFLYSDHEIFLRELISNAVDATQKLKTLSSVGEFKGELGDTRVRISIDKNKKTLTVSDHGIGMTAEEVDQYINQIAISGAESFLDQYKDKAEAIIGHFGLGFYSSFMVANKVEIYTLSYKDEAKAVHWSCEGTPEFQMEDTIKAERGTDIVLHIDDEFTQYLEDATIEGLLKKYCKFLPVEIAFGKKKEWKDGKQVELDEENIINDVNPAWMRKPADLKDEDYDKFYHELYPTQFDEPLFHIHLNVDYPFHLTGILYFPKIKNNMDIHRNKIQLYCNQVFVTDEVENIVPEYLTLLHGVIDSPDIPLNVSRSYLQSDNNVKKISGHITKKVADKLAELYKNDRADFEKKWDDIKLFIQFGMLSDEKFYERAIGFTLLKNLDGKYATLEEYKAQVKEAQTDKDGNLIMLYTNDPAAHYTFIERAKAKGYDVLLNHAGGLADGTRLLLIGGEPTDEYRAILTKKGLTNVTFLPLCDKETLNRYYRAADVFVLPTREDMWGLVVNEAMANGLPVVTTENCNAGRELIRDGENGYLVPVEDGDTLIRRTNEILLDEERRGRMAKRALTTARAYTIEAMVRTHLAVFREDPVRFLRR